MRKLAALLFLALFACSHPADAWFPHGTAAAIPGCPQGSGTPADGCSGANQNSLFKDATFFSTVQQSGQGAYATRPPWNVAGVDYPVGPYTADGSLTDVSTNPPAGCNLVPASHWIRCGTGLTISGYRFNGWGIYVDTGTLSITNSHFTMTADNCRNYTGSGMISTHGGSSPISITYSKFDFDDGCKMNARLYKTAIDPGFIDQSSGTASFSGTTMTYSAINSGTVRTGQYIYYTGMTTPVQITSGSGLVWTVDTSQGTVGPVTVTTGPVQVSYNGPIGVGSGSDLTLQYNVNLDSGQFSSAANNADARFNYERILGTAGQHVNFIFNNPSSCHTTSFVEDFNTVYWDKYTSGLPAGTGTIDYFSTGGNVSQTCQNIADYVSISNNVIVANNTIYGGGGHPTNALVRYLGQGSLTSGNIRYTQTGGVMTVTSVISGVVTAGYYAQCPSCTIPNVISAFGGTCAGIPCTGSGGTGTYLISNTVDTVNNTSGSGGCCNVSAYPGQITVLDVNNNYLDKTGADGPYNFDRGGVPVGTTNNSGNINLLTDNACNYIGGCN